jgi:hypothetical protein
VVLVGAQVTTRVAGGTAARQGRPTRGRRGSSSISLPRRRSEEAFPGPRSGGSATVEVADATGRVLIAHTEGRYDCRCRVPKWRSVRSARASFRPRAAVGRRLRRAGPWRGAGWQAAARVEHVRERPRALPGELRARAGRGAPGGGLKRFVEAVPRLEEALARVSNDADTLVLPGLCPCRAGGRRAERATLWEPLPFPEHARGRPFCSSRVCAPRGGDSERARPHHPQAVAEDGDDALRRPGGSLSSAAADAPRRRRRGSRVGRARDQTSAILRTKQGGLGSPGPLALAAFAGDAQRVLEVAATTWDIGAGTTRSVLDHPYPSGAGVVCERERRGRARHPRSRTPRLLQGAAGTLGPRGFQAASRMPATVRVPSARGDNRWCWRARSSMTRRGARSRGMPHQVAPSRFRADIVAGRHRGVGAGPADSRLRGCRCLHRNLGLALLSDGQFERAREVAEARAVTAGPVRTSWSDLALDQGTSASLVGHPRSAWPCLERYPGRSRDCRPALVFKLVSRASPRRPVSDDAERLFRGHFVPARGVRDQPAPGLTSRCGLQQRAEMPHGVRALGQESVRSPNDLGGCRSGAWPFTDLRGGRCTSPGGRARPVPCCRGVSRLARRRARRPSSAGGRAADGP